MGSLGGFLKRGRTIVGLCLFIIAAVGVPLRPNVEGLGRAGVGVALCWLVACACWFVGPGWLGRMHWAGGPPWGLVLGSTVGLLLGFLFAAVGEFVGNLFGGIAGLVVIGVIMGLGAWAVLELCTFDPPTASAQKPPDPKTAVPLLVKIIQTQDQPMLRKVAIESLRQFGAAAGDAIPALEAALQDKDEGVRTAAKEVLQAICPDRPAGEPTSTGA